MIENSGFVIFLFGNKIENNKVVISNGIIEEEFRLAKEKKKKIIPIGSTGYAARKI
jgi:activator of 2-hydroxyglutaryl-CoA dehydratase